MNRSASDDAGEGQYGSEVGDKDLFSDNLLNLAARLLCCKVTSRQVSVYKVLSSQHTQCYGLPLILPSLFLAW